MGMKLAGANLFWKGGLVNGSRALAAFSAVGTELTGNSYARIPMTLADWTISGSGFRNADVQTFPIPAPLAWLPVTHWGLYSAASGGNLLLDYDSDDTAAPQLGASVGFDAGAVGWNFVAGKITQQGARAGCRSGLVSGTRTLTLHSGTVASGSNFVDQPVTVAASLWTASTVANTPGTSDGQRHRRLRNNAAVNFGLALSDLPEIMSVALRNGTDGSSADILWSSTFSMTASDPGPGDRLSFAANAITMIMPID